MAGTKSVTNRSLASVAKKINSAHREIGGYFNSALGLAIKTGDWLIEVKQELPHGEFGKWVNDNLDFGERQAQRYMKAASNQEQISDSSSLRQAVALLAEPKREVAVEEVDLESGEDEFDELADLRKQLRDAKQLIHDYENDDAEGEFEEMYKDLLKDYEELKKSGAESKNDVEKDLDALKKQREKIRKDINGLKEIASLVSETRTFLTKKIALVPTLHISPTIIKNTRKDIGPLSDLLRNLATALDEKFGIE